MASRAVVTRVLVVVAMALSAVGLVSVPAQAAVSVSVSIQAGTKIRVSYSWSAPDTPTGTPSLVVTSSADTTKVWTLTLTSDTATTAFSSVTFDPRSLSAAATAPAVASVSSTTGLDYLPNGAYTVKMTFPTAAGTSTSNAASFTFNASSAPPTITSPVAGSTSGVSGVSLAMAFAQTPRANSVSAVFTGRDTCSSSSVTYAVTQGSPVPTTITATLGVQGTLQATSTAATQTGAFVRGCHYDVQVRWNNASNQPGYPGDPALPASSSTVTDVYVPAAPDAASDVAATRGNRQASVSWTAPSANGSAISGYTVTSSPEVRTCTTVSTSCDVTGLTNGTAYTFTVVATNGVGDGAASSASGAVTPAGVPGAPAGAAATRGDGQASVSWSVPSANGSPISGYTVTSSPEGQTCTTVSTSCDVTGLSNGTAYTFTVVATNGVGDGAASDASSAVTPAGVPDSPAVVTATPGDGWAEVSWTEPSDHGAAVSGYTVTSVPDGTTCTTTSAPDRGCRVTGLTNGTSYTFAVVAHSAAGDSASASSIAVVPAGVPGTPTQVSAVGGDGQASVSWSAPSANGSPIGGYTVTSSPEGRTCTAVSTSCDVTGLTNGTAYTFTVTATNDVGEGDDSASSAAVVPQSPQAPPSPPEPPVTPPVTPETPPVTPETPTATPVLQVTSSASAGSSRRTVRLVVVSDRAMTVRVTLQRGRSRVVTRTKSLREGTQTLRVRLRKPAPRLTSGKPVRLRVLRGAEVLLSTTVRLDRWK